MPAISEISISQYRGFYDLRSFAPAKPNGSIGSGLTAIVGPNNSGKSSVLNAIRLVLIPRQVDVEHRHDGEQLRISLTNDSGETKSVANPDLGATLIFSGRADAWPASADFRMVPSRRSWNPYTHQQTMEVHGYWNTVFNKTSNDGGDEYFVSRVAKLAPDERIRFDSLLKRLLPQLNNWKIELSRGQTFVQYETHSGAKHAADLFGDGMASIFRIALALVDSGDSSVIAIDEPELSLHPQAQKLLAAVLSEFARNRQIIITTHSPYFINWNDISNGAVVYRLTQERRNIRVGVLQPKTLNNLKGLVSDWQKPNLLDAVSKEVFFADEVVFFEGQEDVGLVRKFAEEEGLEPIEAFGYGSGGFGNVKLFLQMARDLGIPAAAVYDGDHADEKNAVEKQFPEALIQILPTADIRDKMERDHLGKEIPEVQKVGIFDRGGRIRDEYRHWLANLIGEIHAHFDKPT